MSDTYTVQSWTLNFIIKKIYYYLKILLSQTLAHIIEHFGLHIALCFTMIAHGLKVMQVVN